MLDTKNIYIIYLLHHVNEFFKDKKNLSHRNSEIQQKIFLYQTRLNGYLNSTDVIKNNLNDESLLALLAELGEFIDMIPLPAKRKPRFPRTINQFNRAYRSWLKEM